MIPERLLVVPASAGDAPAIADVMSHSGSSWKPSAAEIAKELSTLPGHVRSHYLLGYVDGVPVAHAAVANDRYIDEPASWIVDVYVKESYQRRGFGHEILRTLKEWLAPILAGQRNNGAEPVLLTATVDSPAGDRFATNLGFVVRATRYVSRLDPWSVDLSRFAAIESSIAEAGVTFTTLASVLDRERDKFTHALYVLDNETMADEPDHHGATAGFEAWRAEFIHERDPGGTIVAVHENTPIGLTIHWDDAEEILIAATGVRREWRGRGIATALKLAGVRYARQRGLPLRTVNSAENAPILAINQRIGFERTQTATKWRADPADVQSRLP